MEVVRTSNEPHKHPSPAINPSNGDGKTRLDIAVQGYGSGAVYKSDGWASIILEKDKTPPHWLSLTAGDTVKFSGIIFIKYSDPEYFTYSPEIGSSWPAFSFNFSEIIQID